MTIKEARVFAGLTQPEVEEELGIPIRSLQNWEAGIRQPPEYVEKYLIQELCQRKQVARITIEADQVMVEVADGDEWELSVLSPVKNQQISLSVLQKIGQLAEAGYKLIFR